MHQVDLRRIDLNLLVTLDALLEERNVTRAAARLGMSQPAASRALGRLRDLFSDALLVDGPGGYLLSARATELRPMLKHILAGVGALLGARHFDPAVATAPLRLLMTDLHAAVLAPHLLSRLAEEAPAVDLDIIPPGPAIAAMLENETVDAAVGVIEEAPSGILRRKLFEDRFVTIMRKGHPVSGQKLTLDTYLTLDHMTINVTGTGPAPVDELLSAMGRRRRVRTRVPNFFAAMEIAAGSDLVMTLPESLAYTTAGAARFIMLPPPVELGPIAVSLLWHARDQDAPRHMWLRSLIVAAAQMSVDKDNSR